jgi:membrane protein DedA with SNARE-associated domain
MLHELITIWFHWVEQWGYVGVFLLMAMESSILPVPSEIVMPPAAFWASQGKMSFSGVVLAGTLGSWFGSAVSYWIARWLGKPFLNAFGRYLFMPPEKVALAEAWIKDFGVAGVFISRLLPVVRHLISIPAGILKMPFGKFSLVTLVGAGLWCWVLAWFGQVTIGQRPELLQSPEEMVHVIKDQLSSFVIAVLILGGLYMVARSRMKQKKGRVRV